MKSFSLVAWLLLLPAAGTPPLDPALSKLATKQLKSWAKSATNQHRSELVDHAIAMLNDVQAPLIEAAAGDLDATGLATMLSVLDAFQQNAQAAARNSATTLAAAIPFELQQAFGDIDLGGQRRLGYLPGDGGVLDDFRAQMGKDDHKVYKILLKALGKLAKLIEKQAGTALSFELVEPAVPWITGDEDAFTVGDQQHVTLDVVLVVRGDVGLGRNVLLAGSAADADGQLTVSMRRPDDTELGNATPTPVDGRWTANFGGMDGNPILVRVTRGGATLVEHVVGIP